MKKNKIIEAIIKEQYKVVYDLEKTINVYKNASDIDEEDTIDPEDLSHQTEAKEMQLRLEEKLKREESVIANLTKYKDTEVTTVGNGSLIETDKMFIYVGAVAHPFVYEEKKVLGISQKAPIIQKLVAKTIGDTITIGTEEHIIKGIN